MRTNQSSPRWFVQPIDTEQPLCRRGTCLGVRRGMKHCRRHGKRLLRHPLTLVCEPSVECGIETIETIEQSGPKSLQTLWVQQRRSCRHAHVDPQPFVGQDQVIAVCPQQGGDLSQGSLQLKDRLPQRSSCLFLAAPAPQQRGQLAPQYRPRRCQREHRQQRAGFARSWQNAASRCIICPHRTEQRQAQHRFRETVCHKRRSAHSLAEQ